MDRTSTVIIGIYMPFIYRVSLIRSNTFNAFFLRQSFAMHCDQSSGPLSYFNGEKELY